MSKDDERLEVEFEAWHLEMYRSLSDEIEARNPGDCLDATSDVGYWKTMCVAAWAEKHHPDRHIELALLERQNCNDREDADYEE